MLKSSLLHILNNNMHRNLLMFGRCWVASRSSSSWSRYASLNIYSRFANSVSNFWKVKQVVWITSILLRSQRKHFSVSYPVLISRHKKYANVRRKNSSVSEGDFKRGAGDGNVFDTGYTINLRALQAKMDVTMLKPPKSVQGMTELDRNQFQKTIEVPYVVVEHDKIGLALKHLKKVLLKMDKLKPVQDVESETVRHILLNPLLVSGWEDIKETVNSLDVNTEEQLPHQKIILTYENWKADDILTAVLPEDQEGATSYSRIGHMIHLNLRDHLLSYRFLIGQVMLDKVPGITMVVNKTNTIDNTFRNFSMEVVAGEGDTVTTVKENGRTFQFDFAKVYWNPRLSTEHERIVNKLKHGDVLYDVMAGVGPFTIPAARKKCRVIANDLNPDSFKWLKTNCKVNKVTDRVSCHNVDGKEFIRSQLREDLLQVWNDLHFTGNIHITMNLPAMAVEFLPSFIDLFHDDDIPETVKKSERLLLPTVHIYMFCQEAKDSIAIQMVAEQLGCTQDLFSVSTEGSVEGSQNIGKRTCASIQDIKPYIKEVVNVRSVAPNKVMMRVSMHLPLELLCQSMSVIHDTKRMKKEDCS